MNIEQAKSYLDITGTDNDAQIQLILDGVLALFWKLIGKDLTIDENITEYYNGGSERHIFLNRYPVNSVATIKINTGTGVNPIREPINSDYVVQEKKGMITFPGGYVPRGYKNVQIVYSAGYAEADMPDDIIMAVLQTVASLRNKKKGNWEGKTSEAIDDYSVTFSSADISPTVRDVLSSHRQFNV